MGSLWAHFWVCVALRGMLSEHLRSILLPAADRKGRPRVPRDVFRAISGRFGGRFLRFSVDLPIERVELQRKVPTLPKHYYIHAFVRVGPCVHEQKIEQKSSENRSEGASRTSRAKKFDFLGLRGDLASILAAAGCLLALPDLLSGAPGGSRGGPGHSQGAPGGRRKRSWDAPWTFWGVRGGPGSLPGSILGHFCWPWAIPRHRFWYDSRVVQPQSLLTASDTPQRPHLLLGRWHVAETFENATIPLKPC